MCAFEKTAKPTGAFGLWWHYGLRSLVTPRAKDCTELSESSSILAATASESPPDVMNQNMRIHKPCVCL